MAAPGRADRASAARLPVVEHVSVADGAAERERLDEIAESLRAGDPEIAELEPYAPAARPGLGDGPALVIHDLACIAAVPEELRTVSEYRALPLAGPGDVVAVGTMRVPAFEAYWRDVLGLGPVDVIRPDESAPGRARSLSVRCREDPRVLRRLAARAARHGGLDVLPYMGTAETWELAAAIGRRADVPVRVAAPPPKLSACANDKLWFIERVEDLLGEDAVPPSAEAFSVDELAARVRTLARRNHRLAIKLPHAAAGAGNLVLEADPLRDAPLPELRTTLRRLLRRHGWREPLQVSIWEAPVVTSPSVQLWLRDPGTGGPVVEGIFEQRVAGSVGAFVGAAPSRLPAQWQTRLAGEAALIGELFQRLGYIGRCSLDAILVGDGLDHARLHWVEANARWGGTSIPMTVVNRLTGDWAEHPFVTVAEGPALPFAEILERAGDRLFRPGTRDADAGIVLLSPTDPDEDRGVAYLAIGRSLEDAERRARELEEALR